MRKLWEDLRLALRGLRRRPGFAAAVVATLALGIGGNVALFSVVDGVLLRPLPYPDPDRLVIVWENDRLRGTDREGASAPDYLDLVEQSRSFETMALWFPWTYNLSGNHAEPERVNAIVITPDVFRVLGIAPAKSRDLHQATKSFLEAVAPGNPDLRIAGDPSSVKMSGRAALGTPLTNKSVLGGTEQISLYTTLLADGDLFYYLCVAPEKEGVTRSSRSRWSP